MSVLSSKWWTDKQGAHCTSQQTFWHLRSLLVFMEGSNNGPVLIQPQTVGNSRWLQLERGMCHQAGDTKVLWRRIWWEILYSQPERNQPHPKPLQLPSSSPQLIVYSGACNKDPQWQNLSTTSIMDFLLWFFIFFADFFVVAPHIFWYSHCHKKGLDSCHDLILCTLVSYNWKSSACLNWITEWPTLSGELVDRATTSSPCTHEWEHHRTCVYHTHLYAILH